MTYTNEQMEQLFTNTTVFGEMEPWVQKAMRELAGVYGVELRGGDGWLDCGFPRTYHNTYRLKRPDFAMPEWFWNALRDDYKYVTMDEDGAWCVWEGKPVRGGDYWYSGFGFKYLMILDLPKHPDWRNSLQVRPGHTEE